HDSFTVRHCEPPVRPEVAGYDDRDIEPGEGYFSRHPEARADGVPRRTMAKSAPAGTLRGSARSAEHLRMTGIIYFNNY
ncbi:MAG: hypothetical protein KGI48_16535, partial [Hyphomicrobiales bacterium]|nr:hypothetical protein [Hyphomicrobiales bacterium]